MPPASSLASFKVLTSLPRTDGGAAWAMPSSGKAFGEDVYKAAQEGKITEVSYMFPKPGATEPSPKVSFVTKVGDLGCGVGYYK